jgi:hypothetical protein
MTVIRTAGPDPARPILVEVEPGPGLDVDRDIDVDRDVADEYADVEVRGERLRRLRQASGDLVADGLDLVRTCAERVSATVARTAQDALPDELEVQIAVKLDYELGAVLVAKGSAGAQLVVTMRWTQDQPRQPRPDQP